MRYPKWMIYLVYVAISSFLIVPMLAPTYLVLLLADALVLGLLVMSLDIVLGYTGLFNLAQASAWGSGCYAVVFAKIWYGIPLWLGLLFAPLGGLVTGLVIGLISSRVNKAYFPILTLGIAEVYHRAFMYWSVDVGAELGLFLLGEYYNPRDLCYLILFICFVSYWVCKKVMDSPFGHTLQAIRENEIRASFVGCNVGMYKCFSLAFSGIFAGVAGGLRAVLYGMVDIHFLHWIYSSEAMALNVIGGLGTLTGPLILGSALSFLKFVLNFYIGVGYLITIGLMLIVVALYIPRGFPKLLQRAYAYFILGGSSRKQAMKK